jgi:hypothetical protein
LSRFSLAGLLSGGDGMYNFTYQYRKEVGAAYGAYWVGLDDAASEGVFAWADGESGGARPMPWATGGAPANQTADNDCVAAVFAPGPLGNGSVAGGLAAGVTLVTRSCAERLPYVCSVREDADADLAAAAAGGLAAVAGGGGGAAARRHALALRRPGSGQLFEYLFFRRADLARDAAAQVHWVAHSGRGGA